MLRCQRTGARDCSVKTVTVNAIALRELLIAVNGGAHQIRELQATRGPVLGHDNPIDILVGEFNQAVAKHNAEVLGVAA